jgi:raffinose/stachyose/melibiose transport system substrate-binding protein
MEAELRARLGRDDMNYVVLQSGVKYVNDQWFDIGTDLEAMFYDALTPAEVVASIEERRDELARSQEDPNW